VDHRFELSLERVVRELREALALAFFG